MRQTRLIMDMPITVEIVDAGATRKNFQAIFSYFTYIDSVFSTYKQASEISNINNRRIVERDYSRDMKEVLRLCEQTKQATHGYFDCVHNNVIDPSGLVKGWAIQQAALQLKHQGFSNYYIDAGGDIAVAGKNHQGEKWKVGIRNPFNRQEIVKVLMLSNKGIATSGTSVRGQHIYNPHQEGKMLEDVLSLTVVGPNVYEADRFATAAFAMGTEGITFIEQLPGFEGYQIDRKGIATFTRGFMTYL